MSQRCHSPMRSARPASTFIAPSASLSTTHWKNYSPTENTPVVQRGAEAASVESARELARQALFQSKSNEALMIPTGYLKVAVLIIRWHPSIDEFEGHTAEVRDIRPGQIHRASLNAQQIASLRNIFETDFRYTCKVHEIQNSTMPQVDLNKAVYNHISEHDGPHNLLIFYYTGHGSRIHGKGLELSATQNFANTSERHMPVALWESAEEPIIRYMEGDALSIFDCCMASSAGFKGRHASLRAYQLLAASPAIANTYGPGQDSFTTALCDSLEELLQHANGGTFSLTQLYEKINTKRLSQACVSWDRLGLFKRNILLGRLEQSESSEDTFLHSQPELSSLLLRLSFKSKDLEDHQIENLAERFPKVCHEAAVQLLRVDWLRMAVSERGTEQNLGIYRNDSRDAGLQNDGLLAIDNNDPLVRQLGDDFYQASRTVRVAQNFRAAVRRKQAVRARLTHCPAAHCVPYRFIAAMILKFVSLSLMFSSLYFRGEQTALVLCGIMMAFMVIYGPCKLPALRLSQNWETNQDSGPDEDKCCEVRVAS